MTTFASFQNTTFDPIHVGTLLRLDYGFIANVHEAPAARQDEAARAALPRSRRPRREPRNRVATCRRRTCGRTHPLASASISLHV